MARSKAATQLAWCSVLSPRWRKLLGDVRATRGRMALMVLAMAVGVCGVATMLSSYSILDRETRRNYLATNPPSATLNLEHIDPALVDKVRHFPGIKEAQAASTVTAVINTSSGEALPMVIFVVDDFNALRINTVYRDSGAWPPPPGALMFEREALQLIKHKVGDTVSVKTPDGKLHAMPAAGTLHDPALPPASRGTTVYAYATPATVAAIGLNGSLRNLKLTVTERPFDVEAIESTVARLALWLGEQGQSVSRIRIPPPGQHPHQSIMSSLQVMLLIFAAIAMVLGAVLTATIMGGMLALQVRQIGVMKTVGARTSQVAALYMVLVLVLGVLATTIGTVAGVAFGRIWSSIVLKQILNFTMESNAIPAWNYAVLILSGILLPLLLAAVPVLRAARISVQAAINDSGSAAPAPGTGKPWFAFLDRSLALALRNSLRRRGRLLLTLGLLSCAGAMFISSLNVRRASEQHLVVAAEDRLHDLETILSQPAPVDQVKRIIAAVPGVARVEAWHRTSAARGRADGLEIERVYPDGAHGTLSIAAPEDGSALLKLQLLEGRWTGPGESGTAVLNNSALEFFPKARLGDMIDLASHGRTVRLRLVGIARQHMTGATVYVTPASFSVFADLARGDAFRIGMRAHDDASIARVSKAIEAALLAQSIKTRLNITETMLRKDVDGHFDLLIRAMLFIAVLMGVVGAIGLGSAMGSNVAERSREFGIMRSIGATPAVVMRNVLCEGVFIGVLSFPLAILLALPLSLAIGNFLGEMLFGLGFPLVMSPLAVALWCLLVLAGSLAASSLPARRAARLRIHAALSHL
jgi:putative ABC transport system permease protein